MPTCMNLGGRERTPYHASGMHADIKKEAVCLRCHGVATTTCGGGHSVHQSLCRDLMTLLMCHWQA